MIEGDAAANQRLENKRKGDGQRGHDDRYEYPKMLFKGTDHIVVDDLDGELTATADGWSTGEVQIPNPMVDELVRLRAELAARDGAEVRRGPGRPPKVSEAI